MKEEKNPVSDEKKDEDGEISFRVYRGGSWFRLARFTRVLYRYYYDPMLRNNFGLGFRIVRNKK